MANSEHTPFIATVVAISAVFAVTAYIAFKAPSATGAVQAAALAESSVIKQAVPNSQPPR